MQISIANVINSSVNQSFVKEKYQINDCPGFVGNKVSAGYTVGTFTIGDRVTYTVGGIDSYGNIIGITTATSDNISIASTGTNNAPCTQDDVSFTIFFTKEGDNLKLSLNAAANSNSLVSTSGQYALSFYYYIDIDWIDSNDNSGSFTVSGTFNIPNYNIIPSIGWNLLGNVTHPFPVSGVTSFNITYEETQPSFANTIPYTGNDCNNQYFVRNSGYSFFTYFPTNC